MNPTVDFYFDKARNWKEEIRKLRTIILDCHLTEELKWGCPCYTCPTGSSGRAFEEKNIVLIHTFKEYCGVLFFKGALLKNTHGILIQQTENVQAARQVRFTSINDVNDKAAFLREHIFEAVEVEESGLKVELKKVTEFKMSEEFQKKLDKMLP